MNHARPNKSVIGLGSNARTIGGGIYMYRSRNVIIRNLTIENADEDAIAVFASLRLGENRLPNK